MYFVNSHFKINHNKQNLFVPCYGNVAKTRALVMAKPIAVRKKK